ncbi:DNA alkylation repair protein [Streptosporangium sp. NPDC049644]|uniref:DNA alkylation repair protein n=1 Tax=Streptosporangium sp. NPDC049644 TaxID=3155507 RepID=UPI00342D72A3
MPFADELIGPDTARALARAVGAVVPDARLTALRAATSELGPLSLRERADLLRDALLRDLPGDYGSFAGTVRAALNGRHPFSGWLIWPVSGAVATKAIEDGSGEAFDDALDALAELTPRLTSEFAIRLLLERDLDRAMARIIDWTVHPDEHVRRLATEGTRAFLPWAKRVPAILANPRSTVPVISALYRDESEYVRRSVANHLNDLSRERPDLVIETAAAWLADPDGNTRRVVRHGLRTLIKKGHPGALELMGFTPGTVVEIVGPKLAGTTVPFGGTLRFTVSVTNPGQEPVRLAIDYIVHHRKANGSQSGKTFKLTTRTLAPGDTIDLSRDHSFREITTRRYHPGTHAVEVQVNGVASGRTDFTLLAPG